VRLPVFRRRRQLHRMRPGTCDLRSHLVLHQSRPGVSLIKRFSSSLTGPNKLWCLSLARHFTGPKVTSLFTVVIHECS
jgi:hypothetical protein